MSPSGLICMTPGAFDGLLCLSFGYLGMGVLFAAGALACLFFGRGPRDQQTGRRMPSWGLYMCGILLGALAAVLMAAGVGSETTDFRSYYLRQDQGELFVDGPSGEISLSSAIHSKLCEKTLQKIDPNQVSVFSRVELDRNQVLVLIRAPKELRFTRDGREVTQKIPDSLIKPIFADLDAVLKTRPDLKDKKVFVGVRGYDSDGYRAIRTPPGKGIVLDPGFRPKAMLRFYGNQPIAKKPDRTPEPNNIPLTRETGSR